MFNIDFQYIKICTIQLSIILLHPEIGLDPANPITQTMLNLLEYHWNSIEKLLKS